MIEAFGLQNKPFGQMSLCDGQTACHRSSEGTDCIGLRPVIRGVQKGRSLLQNDSASAVAAAKGQLYNVAAVTIQANCSDSNAVAATMREMDSVITNNLLAVR